jgi:predicted NAD/FAD-dependent oxidoreductase
MVAFDSPVAADFDAAFVEERRGSPLGFIARDSTKPGRASGERWVLHAGPAWSAAHLEDPAEAVGPALLEALEQIIGAAAPSVLSLSAHRWRYALPTSLHAARCVHDDGVRLGACGDAFNGARVEGAWLSGRALAEVMLSA